MKAITCCIFLSIFLLIHSAATSQSVYDIHYNFHGSPDSTSYHAFLMRYSNGSGFVRVKYKATDTNQDITAEMDTQEEYPINSSGIEDTTTLLVKPKSPRITSGDSTIKYDPPVFVFQINSTTGYFEPKGISSPQANPIKVDGGNFTSVLIDQADLTKPLVLQFFNKDETFFKSVFKPKTRGGFALSADEKKIKLYLLIVVDVNDEKIGGSCKLDMNRALETFDSLAKYTGIQYIAKTISDKTYSKKNIEAAIAALKPSKNDIVVFYYSGHGFRIPERPRNFPNLKLKNFAVERKNFRDSISWVQKSRQENITYSMNIEDIYNSLKTKGARFTLVLSDCCNDDIFSVPPTSGTKPGKTRGTITYSDNNIRDLFFNKTPMSILASATKPGQLAASKNDFGGFFSYYFKTTMETFASKSKNNVNWEQILQETSKQTSFKARHTYCDTTPPLTPEKICQQEPLYQVLIEK